MALKLSADRGMIFRILHVSNLPWLLANGLLAANSAVRDPNFTSIGKQDLIEHRAARAVAIPPYGTLASYVPFYFTPKSPMLLNIRTGFGGVIRRPNSEIVILVSSVDALQENGVQVLFTDRHAYMATATWSADPADLETMIDWDILRRHDFARSDAYPDKKDRYQAEALAYGYVPVAALIGIACVSESERAKIERTVASAGLELPVRARPEWYFL